MNVKDFIVEFEKNIEELEDFNNKLNINNFLIKTKNEDILTNFLSIFIKNKSPKSLYATNLKETTSEILLELENLDIYICNFFNKINNKTEKRDKVSEILEELSNKKNFFVKIRFFYQLLRQLIKEMQSTFYIKFQNNNNIASEKELNEYIKNIHSLNISSDENELIDKLKKLENIYNNNITLFEQILKPTIDADIIYAGKETIPQNLTDDKPLEIITFTNPIPFDILLNKKINIKGNISKKVEIWFGKARSFPLTGENHCTDAPSYKSRTLYEHPKDLITTTKTKIVDNKEEISKSIINGLDKGKAGFELKYTTKLNGRKEYGKNIILMDDIRLQKKKSIKGLIEVSYTIYVAHLTPTIDEYGAYERRHNIVKSASS